MSEYHNRLDIELFGAESRELYRSGELPNQLLRTGIERNIQKAEDITGKIYKTVIREAPTGTQLSEATKKGVRFVLELDEETKDKIEKGLIRLTEENGKYKAQFRLPNGRYGKRIDVTKEIYSKGIDPVQMSAALQMKALQQQIEQIERQIQTISRSVGEVLRGLQNDRIGLYYSGVNLYLESLNLSNPVMRQLMVAQALRSLSDASYQLVLEIKSDINYLQNKEYQKEKKQKELILGRMESIDQSFNIIHRAMLMRAAIYCNESELEAMASVLTEYSHFIEGVISNNAKMLAQCDPRDTGLTDGVWQSRGALRLDAGEFAKQLSRTNGTMYIELTGEGTGNEE